MKKNWTREFRNSESASRQFLSVSKKNIWVGRFLAQSVGLPQTKIILRIALVPGYKSCNQVLIFGGVTFIWKVRVR